MSITVGCHPTTLSVNTHLCAGAVCQVWIFMLLARSSLVRAASEVLDSSLGFPFQKG